MKMNLVIFAQEGEYELDLDRQRCRTPAGLWRDVAGLWNIQPTLRGRIAWADGQSVSLTLPILHVTARPKPIEWLPPLFGQYWLRRVWLLITKPFTRKGAT